MSADETPPDKADEPEEEEEEVAVTFKDLVSERLVILWTTTWLSSECFYFPFPVVLITPFYLYIMYYYCTTRTSDDFHRTDTLDNFS